MCVPLDFMLNTPRNTQSHANERNMRKKFMCLFQAMVISEYIKFTIQQNLIYNLKEFKFEGIFICRKKINSILRCKKIILKWNTKQHLLKANNINTYMNNLRSLLPFTRLYVYKNVKSNYD